MSNKDLVIDAVQQMSEEASMEQIRDEISLLTALREGEDDADAGRTVPHEEVKQQIRQWLSAE